MWAVLVPKFLPYATIAWVPPVVGLYAAPCDTDATTSYREEPRNA